MEQEIKNKMGKSEGNTKTKAHQTIERKQGKKMRSRKSKNENQQ